MRVLVTGGTGYVGACIVAGLVRAGHDVRLLVRRPEQVQVSLAPYDVVVEDLVMGTCSTIRPSSGRSRSATRWFTPPRVRPRPPARRRDAADQRQGGRPGAAQRGCRGAGPGRAHLRHGRAHPVRGERTGPAPRRREVPYSRSKIAAEVVARRLQDEGAPVVTVYPGGVYAPHDPTGV